MAATADDDDYEVIYEVFQTITVTVSVELLTTMFLLNSFPKFVCVCCKLNCDRTLISWYGDQVHLSSNCMEIHISLFISFCLFIWKKTTTKKPTSLATREREREREYQLISQLIIISRNEKITPLKSCKEAWKAVSDRSHSQWLNYKHCILFSE